MAQATMLQCDIVELQKKDRVMACGLSIMQNLQALQRSVINYQREKKCSDDLKKSQKKATVLEGDIRKEEEEEINAANRELKKGQSSKDRSAWFVTCSLVAYPKPYPEPYSPILLLGFKREEYLTDLKRGEGNKKVGVFEVEADKEAEKEANYVEGGLLEPP
ncbi:hypothetical protein Acr_23g0011080 [Actinidia rufa]|uniref:Uncharacterized protein n=1 Tax=Actinidia rufa TaxID=165716 RepID=A0A7J0GPL4_9ERIC|nr:hypothetical protein Acr_23g0011080 [Actinidia rufa]